MSNSFSKPAGFLKWLSYACYAASGWATWVNGTYTVRAYEAAGIPDPLPIMAAIIFSVIQAAFFSYLFAPEIWQEVAGDFRQEASQGMGTFTGAGRWMAAVALSLKLVVILAATTASIWADWQSTLSYLNVSADSIYDIYKGAIALVLVLGGEVLMIFGYQVFRLARIHGIKQAQESFTMNPAWTHAETAAAAATKAAREQAKKAQWGQPR